MKVPISWLKDYVDIDVDIKHFADEMTMSGSKVEDIEIQGGDISKVVTGKVLSIEKHPNADRLRVSQIDTGSGIIQVVTGAENVQAGDVVPVALDGSTLPGGIKITKGKLRGIESNGMMCSIGELALSKEDYPDAEEHGIFILDSATPVGMDIKTLLGLNETIIDFEITSNRPDCLSIVGMAREAAVTFKKAFRYPKIEVQETKSDKAEKYANVEIADTDLCSRYAARVVKNVKVGPSPDWMKSRLKAAGIRPINNIVDVTNYVMLELGQPMHAFDLENISGKKIIVRRAKENEIMKTLDDKERTLDSSMLVIADAEKAVAIAGVMGGANSEITENTKTILLESACFNGTSVRVTANKIGIRTEASSRFEKGLDPENVKYALDRAAQLISDMGAGDVCEGIIDRYPHKPKELKIVFDPERINQLLGTEIKEDYMTDIFERLGFKVDKAGKQLTVPTFRGDIEGNADLAEEIARFYGYNNIKPTLLDGKPSTLGKKSYKQGVEDLIINTMVSCGLLEAYTFSFTSPNVFDRIRIPKDSSLRKAVVLSNPLGEEQSIMRTTVIPDMLSVLSTNYSRRIKQTRLFEFSKVYIPEELPLEELPLEKKMLTIGMYGNVDFYDIKGIVEALVSVLGLEDNCSFEKLKNNPTFHPGRAAALIVNSREAGVIGEIHPEVAEEYGIEERVYIAELDADLLIENANLKKEYSQLPKYPAVERDLAMIISDSVSVKDIEDIIWDESGDILESIHLFDIYRGKQIPDGYKSVAYSLTFRVDDRTLSDEEVNPAIDRVINSLEKKLEARLRK